MKSLVEGLLISKKPRGCRQAYYAKKLTGSPTPKPTSFSDSVLCVGRMRDDRFANWKRQISLVFGKHSLQRDESNRWNADGVRVENIPHSVGPPREDSKTNERSTV